MPIKSFMKLLPLLALFLLFAAAGNAAISEYNYTDLNYSCNDYSSTPFYLDIDTGANTTNLTSDSDIFFNSTVNAVNGAIFAFVSNDIGLAYDCSKPEYLQNQTFAVFENWSALCIRSNIGKYGILATDFGLFHCDPASLHIITLRYQSDGSQNFGFPQRNLTGTYTIFPYWGMNNDQTNIDADKGIAYFNTGKGARQFYNAPDIPTASFEYFWNFTPVSANIWAANNAQILAMPVTATDENCLGNITSLNFLNSTNPNGNASGFSWCVKSTANNYLKVNADPTLINASISPIGGGTFSISPVTMPTYFTGRADAINVPDIYFDFETGSLSNASFALADFHLNTITPSLNSIGSITEGFYGSSPSFAFSHLVEVDCTANFVNYFNSSNTFYSLNLNGFPDLRCFNLSSSHNGTAYYGAIQLNAINQPLNATANLTQFYWALYSPNYNAFTIQSITPVPPVMLGSNVTLVYTSTIPMTTKIMTRFEIPSTLAMSNFITFEDANAFNTTHTISIPAWAMPMATSHFQIWIAGTDASSSLYASLNAVGEFEIISNLTNATLQQAFESSFNDGIIVQTQDASGNPADASCFFDDSPMSFQGLHKTFYINGLPVTIFYQQFLGSWSHIGTHTINCTATDPISNLAGTNQTFYASAIPFFYTYRFTQGTSGCSKVLYVSSESSCQSNMLLKNISAWYCYRDINRCAVFNAQDGTCLTWGVWIGSECPSCSAVPEGFLCNGTTITQGNQTSTPTNLLCQGIGGMLNVDCNSSLAFVALIITLIITAGIGVLTRSGIVSGIIFETLLAAFYFINWLPIWIPIVLGTLAAFLIAKFISDAIMPQAR